MFAFDDILSTEQTHNFKLAYGKSLIIVFLIPIQNIHPSYRVIVKQRFHLIKKIKSIIYKTSKSFNRVCVKNFLFLILTVCS